MRESLFKKILGLTIICIHIFIVFLILYYKNDNQFGDEDLKIALSIIIPLFATYMTLIIKDFIDERYLKKNEDKKINFSFIIITTLFTVGIFLSIICVLDSQANNGYSSEDFAFYLSIPESVFGLYLGMIFKSLYSEKTN